MTYSVHATNALVSNQAPPENLTFNAEQNYVIRFINYDPELTDLQAIEQNLPAIIEQPELSYSVTYDIDFANTTYQQQINDYIDSISTDDWTSSLNRTALNEQKDHFERKDIFGRQNGTAINADDLEQYLSNNKPHTSLPDNNRFYIFVFNLTRLDMGKAHWFNVTEVDVDSNRARFWWRLEWDYPMNYDTKFPYAAYTKQTDIAMLDPTAFQWYLTWRMIWNQDVRAHASYNHTLTELLSRENTNAQKSQIVEDTTSIWIQDWLAQIFNIYTFPLEFGTSVDVQLLVIYDSQEKNKTDLEWIINGDLIEDNTNFILKSDQLNVETNYVDRQANPTIANYLAGREVNYETLQPGDSPFDSWTYYDGYAIWDDTNKPESQLRQEFFSSSNSSISIYGTILLLDNASYAAYSSYIPWTGGLFTGLGGDQTVTMLYELDRAFMPDGESHKAGLSKVLIHEIGHSIGFPHTFSNSFISDFANDVMGYYPATANYTQIVSSIYFRTATDKLIIKVKDLYTDVYDRLVDIQDSKLLDLQQSWNTAIDLHKLKQYYRAWETLFTMKNDLQSILNQPVPTSNEHSTSVTSSNEPAPFTSLAIIVGILPLLPHRKRK